MIDDERLKDTQDEYSVTTHIKPNTGAWLPFLYSFNIHDGRALFLPRIVVTLGTSQGYEHYWREDVYFLPLSQNQQHLAMAEQDKYENYLVRVRLFYSDNIMSFDSIPGFSYFGHDFKGYKIKYASQAYPFQPYLEILLSAFSPIMAQMLSVRGLEHVKPELWADAASKLSKGLSFLIPDLTPKGMRGGYLIENIEKWTETAIENMAQRAKQKGKIIPYTFKYFCEAFPLQTSRQNFYNLLPAQERADLEARYLKRCADLMSKTQD